MSFTFFNMMVLTVLFSGRCTSDVKKSPEGLAVYKIRLLDKRTKASSYNPLEPDVKIWFRDGFIIREIPLTNIFTHNNGAEEYENSVERYEFIDLASNHACEYLTFSDTAKIVNKYKREPPNKVNSTLFFDLNIFTREDLVELPDTLINGKNYKRVRSHSTHISNDPEENEYYGKQLDVMTIGYLDCAMKKYSFLSLEPLFGKKRGCPVMRIDNIHLTADLPATTQEIEVVATKLSPFERKVFDAWEKNAKTYKQ